MRRLYYGLTRFEWVLLAIGAASVVRMGYIWVAL